MNDYKKFDETQEYISSKIKKDLWNKAIPIEDKNPYIYEMQCIIQNLIKIHQQNR